jgi:three-Cys-motif partner protein
MKSKMDQVEMFEGASTARARTIKLKSLDRPLWTHNKAKLIDRYVYYFVLVTKHGTYLDCYGGPQSPENEDMWAAKLVLESRPRWLRKLVLGDLNKDQVKRLQALRDRQPPREKKEPKREVVIMQGDFNAIVDQALTHVNPKQAAFCLLDQRTFECKWSTVERVARYKKTGNKIEIFYFLPVGWLARAASGLKAPETDLRAWWGRDDWETLRKSSVHAIADMTTARFTAELGYAFAYAWPIFERENGGRILYYMIHASDHKDAVKLMRRAYSKALDQPEPPDQLDFLRP